MELERMRIPAFLESLAGRLASIEGAERAHIGMGTLADPRSVFASYNQWFCFWSQCSCKIADGVPCLPSVIRILLNWVNVNIVNKGFDQGYPMDSSLISEHAGFSPMLGLHLLFFWTLKRADDPRAVLEQLCLAEGFDFDLMCRAVVVLPVRLIAAGFIVTDAEASRLPSRLVQLLGDLVKVGSDLRVFRILFGFVQLVFGICKDKDAFLRLITAVFGLSERLSLAMRLQAELACVTFISSLLCDRSIFENDKLAWVVGAIITRLRDGELSANHLKDLLAPRHLTESKVMDRLASVIRIDQSGISLIDGSSWHIAQCWNCEYLHKTLLRQAAANRNILFPFPQWTDIPVIDLASALHSRYFFALLYDILFRQLTCPSVIVHYALNFFILLANHAPPAAQTAPVQVVAADSVDALALAIPDNFRIFARTPVYYNRGVPLTLVQAIEDLGDLGTKALVHANIGWSRGSAERPDIGALKRAIVAEYTAKWRALEHSQLSSQPNAAPMATASESFGFFVYPTVVFRTAVPSFIKQGQVSDLVRTRHAYCCTHRVSQLWLEADGEVTTCPVCEHARNAAVIAFSPDLCEFELVGARRWAERIARFLLLDGGTVTTILASHIAVLEARAALRPEVLDSEDTRLLHRNLWLTILLALGGQAPRQISTPTGIEVVMAQCLRILGGSRAATLTWAMLREWLPQECDLPLARQLLLFGHFMLGLPITNDAVDWDAVLEPDGLMQILGLKLSDEPRAIVKTVPLADDWIDLLMPPYNIDIVNMRDMTGICLLTGTRILFRQMMHEGDGVVIFEYLHNTWKDGPALVLHVTGNRASQIQIASLEFNVYFNAADAWLDKNGTPDHGFNQGKLLSLNRSIFAEVLDDYLSGKFHGKIR
jgi:hypothetical protein